MILPLRWLHIYAPLLPFSLLSHLACPTPYIVGVHASYANEALLTARNAQSNLCVVDLDAGSIERHGAVPLLPDVPRSLAATTLQHELHPELACSDSISIGSGKQAHVAHAEKTERLRRAAQVIRRVVNTLTAGSADHCVRLMDWASHRATASSVRVQHQAPKGAPISEVMGENDVMLLDESAFIASRLKALSQLQRSDLACGHGSAAESPSPTALCSRATTEHESEHDFNPKSSQNARMNTISILNRARTRE